MPDDGSSLPKQRQICAKAGGQFHAVITIDKDKARDLPHVGQSLPQHRERLIAGQHFDFMALAEKSAGDGVNARRVSLAFAAAAIKNARHEM